MPELQGMESSAPMNPMARAMAILVKDHPNRSGKLVLRSGSDKRGTLMYFEGWKDGCRLEDWRVFRKKEDDEAQEFLRVRSTGCVVDRRGASGMIIHFHESEQP